MTANCVGDVNLTYIVVRVFMESYFLEVPDFCQFGSVDCRTVQINISLCINPAAYNSLCLIVPSVY